MKHSSRLFKVFLLLTMALPLAAGKCVLIDDGKDDGGDWADCMKRADQAYDRCIAAGNTQSACGLQRAQDQNHCKGDISSRSMPATNLVLTRVAVPKRRG